MKKLLFFVSFLVFGIDHMYSQQPALDWVHTFKNSHSNGRDVVTDDDNNLYVLIDFSGAADFDPGIQTLDLGTKGFAVLKFDPSGNLIWGKSVSGEFDDFYLAVDGSKNVFISGIMFGGTVDFDPGVGVYNMTNVSNSVNASFILKLDAQGNFGWAKLLESSSHVSSRAIDVDLFGNVYTAGQFFSSTDFDPGVGVFTLETQISVSHTFILKLNNDGNFIWAKAVHGSGNVTPLDMVIDDSGNVYSSGYFMSTVDFDPGAGTANLSAVGTFEDVFVLKLDSLGNFGWVKGAGGAKSDVSHGIGMDADGNILLTGSYRETANFGYGLPGHSLTADGIAELFVSKLSSAGTLIWNKVIKSGAGDYAQGNDITTDAQGNVYTAGTFSGTVDADPGTNTFPLTSNSTTLSDGLIQKLDAAGDLLWALGFSSDSYYNINSIAVDGQGFITTVGRYAGIADFDPNNGIYADTSVSNFSTGNTNCFIHRLKPFGLSVQEVTEPSTLLYPNPTKSSLVITLDENIGEGVMLRVFDNNGHQMMDRYEYQFAGSSTFDVSHLPAGTYFVQLQSNGKQWVKRFVKL